MGRKSISGEPKTDRPLRIRLTDLERSRIDHAAELAGKTSSAWLRDLGLEAAGQALAAAVRKPAARPARKGAK